MSFHSLAHVHSGSNRCLVLIQPLRILSNAAKRHSQYELLCLVAFVVTFKNWNAGRYMYLVSAQCWPPLGY